MGSTHSYIVLGRSFTHNDMNCTAIRALDDITRNAKQWYLTATHAEISIFNFIH